ncbi:hypothetical protein TDB9533_04339 [Thalassocella blandensis]|nr:hypothetical protein TDB9533_04339 [Thalassocella blandensis]
MNAGSSNQRLTIALAKPTKTLNDEAHTFDLLDRFIVMCQKKTNYPWEICDVDQASVIIAFEGDNRIEDWHSSGRIIVLVQNSRRPGKHYHFTITNPIRVMHVLDLLNTVGEHLLANPVKITATPTSKPSTVQDSAPGEHWALLSAIKTVFDASSPQTAFAIEANGQPKLWLTAKLSQCKISEDYFNNFSQLMSAKIQSKTLENHNPPESAILINGTELLWRSAIDSTQNAQDRAPWLPGNSIYKLKRWPDLGALRAKANLVRMVSTLAKKYVTPEELTQATGSDNRETMAILNALGACGLIDAKPSERQVSSQTQAKPAAKKPEGFSKMIKSLRRHLNI